jgi:hypothetical protein
MVIFFSGGRGDAAAERHPVQLRTKRKVCAMMTFWDFVVADKRRAKNRFKTHRQTRTQP